MLFLPVRVKVTPFMLPEELDKPLEKFVAAGCTALGIYAMPEDLEVLCIPGPIILPTEPHATQLGGSKPGRMTLIVHPILPKCLYHSYNNIGECLYRTFAHELKHILDHYEGKDMSTDRCYSKRLCEKRANAYATKAPMTFELEECCKDLDRVARNYVIPPDRPWTVTFEGKRIKVTTEEMKFVTLWPGSFDLVAKILGVPLDYVVDMYRLLSRRGEQD
jgi:hypothetical protein